MSGAFSMEWEHARFAGSPPTYPKPGEKVRVISGEFQGSEVEVLDLGGHAYHPIHRVVVRNPDGEIVWYWPWNLVGPADVSDDRPVPPE